MADSGDACAARDKLIEGFRTSMVGPGQVDEILVDPPTRTYVCGFLSPGRDVVGDDQNDEFQEGDDHASLEGVPSLVNAMWPSAMGMTFHVQRDVARVEVNITGGFYQSVMVEAEASESSPSPGKKKSRGNPLTAAKKKKSAKEASGGSKEEVENWKRIPFEKTFILDVDGPEEGKIEWTDQGLPGDLLYIDVRRFDHGGDKPRLLTLSLVNSNEYPEGEWQERETKSFFQPMIQVTVAEGEEAECFVEAPAIGSYRDDPDLAQHLLLYRNACDFATGHGCATEWERTSGRHKTATAIRTQFIPTARVRDLHFDIFRVDEENLKKKLIAAVEPACRPGDEPDVIFTMRYLAGGDGRDDEWILAALRSLCDAYEIWLESREAEIDEAIAEIHDESMRAFAREKAAEPNIGEAGQEILARMRVGVKTLESDKVVFRSFRLANEAMHSQLEMQILQKLKRDGKSPDAIDDLEPPRWRPFQLAFLLLTLNSIAVPDLKVSGNEETERELMDLIWFPTGGGKTEAYLGLTAFTLFYRRLSRSDPDSGAGVSVITRYTLRLLTTQQFERATRLLCACEDLRCKSVDIREKKLELGRKKFSIGLWIGGTAAPNRFEDVGGKDDPIEGAVSIVTKLNNGEEPGGTADVRHIRECPWCGTAISNGNIDVVNESGKKLTRSSDVKKGEKLRLLIRCKGSLPAPYSGDCLFTRDEGLPVRIIDDEIYANPPSVIIGTVDKFVRLAWASETRSLFGRLDLKKRLPPPDLIIQDELHLISGPLGTMVGLFETAVDLIAKDDKQLLPKVVGSTATIRRAEDQVWGLFMRKVRQFPPPELTAGDSFFSRTDESKPGRKYMGIMAPGVSGKGLWLRCAGGLLQLAYELEEEVRDPYWTLVCYFNSIRELAGGNVMAQDDVLNYMETLAQTRLRQGGRSEKREMKIPPEELTSRRRSGDIPEILKKLQKPYVTDDGTALDILLATNMISVGVDVDRLGLMMIQGQPKTTSEYIQASSRVGRQEEGPGLILSIASWTRSRDRSHYERFVPYHEAFYREVEPTSVTPWSGPARDRMLSAVLITALRQIEDQMAASPSALESIDEDSLIDLLKPVVDRVAALDPGEVEVTEEEIGTRIRRWKKWAAHYDDAKYGNGMSWDRGTDRLMRSPVAPNGAQDGLEAVPNSMRTVEPETVYRLWRIHRKSD